MIPVTLAASYIYNRYLEETGNVMDEMKLHKLLFFSQRESLVMKNIPMFPEQFEAWKFGPVMVCIREMYKQKNFMTLQELEQTPEIHEYLPVFDAVFQRYASSNSWTLSDLTHSQISWKNARKGYDPDAPCNVHLKIDDIRKDAENIALRRFYVNEILPKLHENH